MARVSTHSSMVPVKLVKSGKGEAGYAVVFKNPDDALRLAKGDKKIWESHVDPKTGQTEYGFKIKADPPPSQAGGQGQGQSGQGSSGHQAAAPPPPTPVQLDPSQGLEEPVGDPKEPAIDPALKAALEALAEAEQGMSGGGQEPPEKLGKGGKGGRTPSADGIASTVCECGTCQAGSKVLAKTASWDEHTYYEV